MNWASFAWGVVAGIGVTVVAWFVVFIVLMGQGDE